MRPKTAHEGEGKPKNWIKSIKLVADGIFLLLATQAAKLVFYSESFL